VLAGFQGSLVVDGYKGYEALFGHFVETINTRSPLGPLPQ
jgi:hypothetical protein